MKRLAKVHDRKRNSAKHGCCQVLTADEEECEKNTASLMEVLGWLENESGSLYIIVRGMKHGN